MLDIGCGCGLITLDITGVGSLGDYLGPLGLYVGIDTNKDLIRWAKKSISRKHDNFYFRHLAVGNGNIPFLEGYLFDVILCKSLFTHLLPNEAGTYLKWISKSLVPNGKCLSTFFLLNGQDLTGKFTFKYRDGPIAYQRKTRPRLAVAYDEKWLVSLFNGLGFSWDIRYGTWSGRQNGLSFQDIVILRKVSR
jgi:SAM-dependent methyltransferase